LLPQSLNASFPLPELLFYLDIDSETALRRITARGKQDIFERLEFQKKAREGYLSLLPVWEREGVQVISLNGRDDPEELGREIWRALSEMPIMKR
jgi:dTMP kinase